jgi:xylulokinase
VDGVYLGVDVGTSATRVSLVRPGGHALVASAGYRTVRAGPGRVEQDPAAWSRALAAALRRLIAHGADLREVTAVGLCGQTPTLVPVDAAGRPIRAALTWQDTRASAMLGDGTRPAAPSEAERARGRRLSARYRRASDAALAWLESSGGDADG